MSVRFKIALTIFITGALTALGVIATVLFAFERFEHETAYYRANAFLKRVGTTYNGMLDMQQRHPEDFAIFLRSLLFFEPNSQLYLLRPDGSIIVSTSAMSLAPSYKVALKPVMDAMGPTPMPYVMGDDPERPGADSGAIIAALPLTHAVIRPDQPVAGYLYLVCQKPIASEGRAEAFRSTFARPALASILAVVALATLLTAWITASVTRPLRRLTEAVATVQRDGLTAGVSTEAALSRIDARRMAVTAARSPGLVRFDEGELAKRNARDPTPSNGTFLALGAGAVVAMLAAGLLARVGFAFRGRSSLVAAAVTAGALGLVAFALSR